MKSDFTNSWVWNGVSADISWCFCNVGYILIFSSQNHFKSSDQSSLRSSECCLSRVQAWGKSLWHHFKRLQKEKSLPSCCYEAQHRQLCIQRNQGHQELPQGRDLSQQYCPLFLMGLGCLLTPCQKSWKENFLWFLFPVALWKRQTKGLITPTLHWTLYLPRRREPPL